MKKIYLSLLLITGFAILSCEDEDLKRIPDINKVTGAVTLMTPPTDPDLTFYNALNALDGEMVSFDIDVNNLGGQNKDKFAESSNLSQQSDTKFLSYLKESYQAYLCGDDARYDDYTEEFTEFLLEQLLYYITIFH